jgi:hypothetical protein
MTLWLVAIGAGLATALLQYGVPFGDGRGRALPPALLRALAIAVLVALILDAPLGRARMLAPFAALDASASWGRGRDSSAWVAARGRVRAAHPESTFAFGDSVRAAPAGDGLPGDLASAVRPAVDRALAAGRSLVVVTDGELDDPSALQALPPGSRVEVLPRPARRDGALVALDAPRAAVGGDTVDVRASIIAGAAGSGRGTLDLQVDGRRVAGAPLDSLAPFGERSVVLRLRIPTADGISLLRAVVATDGDTEPRNDTLTTPLEVSAAAGAVFVSTSPDYDARYALSVLRGALSIPTRGYLRVAPNVWRLDGTLAPVAEEDVRRAARNAPLVIIHGDTLALGRPREATRGTLALLAPPAGEVAADWYVTGAPASPVAGALSGIPWDSLPPIAVSPAAARGAWQALEARQGRRGDRRIVATGTEEPRRAVTVGASGLWRWQFRGGVSADAYATLWGSIFDWLAAERSDVRPALPADPVVRGGESVRWRRGAGSDTVVALTLALRGAEAPAGRRAPAGTSAAAPARLDTLVLHFPPGATLAESRPLAPGIYDVRVPGGTAVLAVNASRELIPRPPTVRPGRVGAGAALADAPRARNASWAYLFVVAALCAEWLLRRRLGLR